jgi:hypothetical protein
MGDGTKIIHYTDTVGTSYVTYTLPTEQESFTIRNKGLKPIQYTVGSYSNVTVNPGESSTVKVDFSSFQVKSTEGIQQFEVLLDEKGDEYPSPFKKITDEIGVLSNLSNTNYINYVINETNKNKGKIAVKRSGDEYWVFLPLADRYMRYVLDRDRVYSTDSMGAPAELTRLVGCYPDVDVYTLVPHDDAGVTKTGTWTTAGVDNIGGVAGDLTLAYANGSSNSIKFTGVRGPRLNFMVKCSPGSGSVRITVNGTVIGTISMYAASNEVCIIDIPGIFNTENNEILFEITVGYFNIYGVNATKLQNEGTSPIRKQSNTVLRWIGFNNTSFYNGDGANDYALRVSKPETPTTNVKWIGSFHGGETIKSLTTYMDGVVKSFNPSDYAIGETFGIEQITGITHSDFTGDVIESHSIMRFDVTGLSMNFKFDFKQSVNVNRAEVMMATNHANLFNAYITSDGTLCTTQTDYVNQGHNAMGVIHFNKDGTYPYVNAQFFYNFKEAIDEWKNSPTRKLTIQRVNGTYQKTYGTRVSQDTIVNAGTVWRVAVKHMSIKSNFFKSLV